MRTDWYVVDTRTNEIVNCVNMHGGPPDLSRWAGAEHLRATRTPSTTQLENYRYWNERP